VAPGFSDESAHDNDHVGKGDPEVNHSPFPLCTPEELLLEGIQCRAALHPAREAVERNLGYHRSDARIFGGDDDDVPTAERGAAQRDPIGVHAFEAARGLRGP
jgi:hypothetical protein